MLGGLVVPWRALPPPHAPTTPYKPWAQGHKIRIYFCVGTEGRLVAVRPSIPKGSAPAELQHETSETLSQFHQAK